MKIAILILAAGSSSRMKRPKQLLEVKDKTLLSLVIENALQSKATTTYCVLGAHAQRIKKSISPYKVQTVINANHKKGLSSSIAKGILHLQPFNYDAVLILLGDQPFIETKFIDTLIDSYVQQPNHISAASYPNKIGVPAIFPKQYFENLLKLKGDKGAQELLNSDIKSITLITNTLADIDTPDDYEKLLKGIL